MGIANRLRWRMAMWLCPRIDTATGKRALERTARECGASKSQAVHIAALFFKRLQEPK